MIDLDKFIRRLLIFLLAAALGFIVFSRARGQDPIKPIGAPVPPGGFKIVRPGPPIDLKIVIERK